MKELLILNREELIEVNGGNTSFAYDVGSFFRFAMHAHGSALRGATVYAVWQSYQR